MLIWQRRHRPVPLDWRHVVLLLHANSVFFRLLEAKNVFSIILIALIVSYSM
jgi:hypothetical protein